MQKRSPDLPTTQPTWLNARFLIAATLATCSALYSCDKDQAIDETADNIEIEEKLECRDSHQKRPAENLQLLFESINDYLSQLYELISQKAFDDKELASDIKKDLEGTKREIEKLETRRQQLLYQEILTPSEKEEVTFLNQIRHDLEELIREINALLKQDFNIDKKIVLNNRSIGEIVRLRKLFDVSNAEILNAAKSGNSDSSELEVLGELSFTDQEIEEVAKRNIFILLKYCTLTASQLDIALKYMPAIYQKPWWFLAEVDLPALFPGLKMQDRMILNIENYFMERKAPKDPLKSGYRDNLFNVDMLTSPFLDDEQKTKIASILIKVGSGLDIQRIVDLYPEFISNESREIAEAKMLNNAYTSSLVIPSLYEATPDSLRGKRIQFITHPFYTFFHADFRQDLWEKCEGDAVRYVENYITDSMKTSLRKGKRGKLTYHYLKTAELFEEYQRYSHFADEEGVIIFILSKLHNYQGERSYYSQAYVNFLNSFLTGTNNVFYLESSSGGSGHLKGVDRLFLDQMIPSDVDVGISGGYIEWCLKETIEDLSNLKKIGRIIKDYGKSVPAKYPSPLFIDEAVISRGYVRMCLRHTKSELQKIDYPARPRVTVDINPDEIDSIDFSDVVRIMSQNNDLNLANKRLLEKCYKDYFIGIERQVVHK